MLTTRDPDFTIPAAPSGPATATGGVLAANSSSTDPYQNVQILLNRKKKAFNYNPNVMRGQAIEDLPGHKVNVDVDQAMSFGALMEGFDKLSDKEYRKLQRDLLAAGLISNSSDYYQVKSVYEKVLKSVADQQGTGSNVTPDEFLNTLIRRNGGAGAKGGPAGGSGGGSGSGSNKQVNTTKSIYSMDPADAKLTLTQMLQQKLGRDPSDAEIEDYIDLVKSNSENDPTVTKAISKADANGNITTTNKTVQSGYTAADAQQQATDQAESAPDYKSYQAAATYMPLLEQMLGGTVGTS